MNKQNMHNNTDISSLQNGLSPYFGSVGYYFKSKIIEGSHEAKK